MASGVDCKAVFEETGSMAVDTLLASVAPGILSAGGGTGTSAFGVTAGGTKAGGTGVGSRDIEAASVEGNGGKGEVLGDRGIRLPPDVAPFRSPLAFLVRSPYALSLIPVLIRILVELDNAVGVSPSSSSATASRSPCVSNELGASILFRLFRSGPDVELVSLLNVYIEYRFEARRSSCWERFKSPRDASGIMFSDPGPGVVGISLSPPEPRSPDEADGASTS